MLAVSCVLAGCSTSTTRDSSSDTGEREYVVTVTDVVDGDTMDVRYRNGSTDTIRPLGVDTPEVYADNDPTEFEGVPDTEAGRDWLREWGQRASAYARREVADRQVRITVDARADRRGAYGRLLVYVSVEGNSLNRQLLAGGYARLYDSSFSKRDRFSRVEAAARANATGLWGFSNASHDGKRPPS